MVELEILEEDFPEWEAFFKKLTDPRENLTIASNPRLGQAIARTFRYSFRVILARKEGKIIGGLPFCKVGKRTVSLPHLSYGGYIGSQEGYEKIMKYLHSHQKPFHIRSFVPHSKSYSDHKVVSILNLKGATSDSLFASFSSNQRRKIRKSYKNGIKTVIGEDDLLEEFYSVYSRNMHRLGSPPLPIDIFSNILTDCGAAEAAIFLVKLNGKTVGGAFVLRYHGFAEDCWLSTLEESNKLYASYQLYWEMISDSLEKGYYHFSFGRSTRESSLHEYKLRWGGEDKVLYYSEPKEVTEGIKQFTVLNEIWKRLPYQLTILLSKPISKRIY